MEGIVDAYYGPPELAAAVEREPPLDPRALVRAAELLLDELEDGWLRDQVLGLRTYAGVLAGEPVSYADEVEGCYGVRPIHTDEAVFAAAHERLGELLPGVGPPATRYERWQESILVPPERVERTVAAVVEEARAWTRGLVELPDGEGVVVEIVRDRPWLAFGEYLGGLRSRIAVNVDVPVSVLELLRLASHERPAKPPRSGALAGAAGVWRRAAGSGAATRRAVGHVELLKRTLSGSSSPCSPAPGGRGLRSHQRQASALQSDGSRTLGCQAGRGPRAGRARRCATRSGPARGGIPAARSSCCRRASAGRLGPLGRHLSATATASRRSPAGPEGLTRGAVFHFPEERRALCRGRRPHRDQDHLPGQGRFVPSRRKRHRFRTRQLAPPCQAGPPRAAVSSRRPVDETRARSAYGRLARWIARRTVAEFLRRVADGDPQRIAELYAEQVDWKLGWPPGDYSGEVPWIRHRSTRAGVAEHFRLIAEHHVAEQSSAEVHSVLVDGAEVVVFGELHNVAKPTGRRYDAAFALHLTIENGLITRHHVHEDSLAVMQAFRR